MKIEAADFAALVERAVANSHLAHMRPVIEKELLHYDILFCLDAAGLLDNLVFQGGTCLRLCYGGNRFSEDLDFAGGSGFSSQDIAQIKTCLEDYIGTRYGLEVNVKEPASLRKDPRYAELAIDKWQVSVVTSPGRKDVPQQRIKIEVANIPAYTKVPLPLRSNYDFLPDGYEDTLIYTETLDEVLADKLIALPATQRYIRHRDIWDIPWLLQQGAQLNLDLVSRKVQDYQLTDFEDRLNQRRQSLPHILAGGEFTAEMRRFLPSDVFDRTLGRDKFLAYLNQTLDKLLTKLQNRLAGKPSTGGDFVM
ncbi:nucleotidyl transferase AbiEii/AbiGii toxin family protein [Gallaecimonas xiamenensis]|uniref:Nucleotidyl transferase AbiEii/AbiGii toxin family protein n=1 Tax=Gallaecimonas xiamenensis 3-C-1 TaxID=745411 RepID=K2J352_9GAMM|nr:nucleotidyl transferase AbiEii/AbiGii toxin family protein [Gallaecimonas xiamenensis]EKE77446.1 hypothetical protein B3C1_01505 [Gallaecimonas xiamenensis 3-C-1]